MTGVARNIKAGDLRQAITLLKPVSVIGAHNRRTVQWIEAATVMAQMNEVSGREFFEAQAFHAEDVVTFTIRWRAEIAATWRIRRGETEYNILEINHLGNMRDYMRIKCRAVQAGGA